MRVEYEQTYREVRAQAIEDVRSRLTEIVDISASETSLSAFRVDLQGSPIYAVVVAFQTVVFGERGPIAFKATLHASKHGERDECSGWFLRHMVSSEKHECLYVQDLIDEAKERGDPAVSGEDAEPAWMELHDDLLRNRYEITPDYYHTLVVGNGLEIDRFPSEPEYDAVFCAEVCVQIERWLYAKLDEYLQRVAALQRQVAELRD